MANLGCDSAGQSIPRVLNDNSTATNSINGSSNGRNASAANAAANATSSRVDDEYLEVSDRMLTQLVNKF